MKLRTGLRIEGAKQNTDCLQLLKDIYGQKQSGIVLNQYILQGPLNTSFKQSDIDKCAFYQDSGLSFFCVYYRCLLITSSKYMQISIAEFKDTKKCQCKFYLEDRGDISYYLGINFAKKNMGTSKLLSHISSTISQQNLDCIE